MTLSTARPDAGRSGWFCLFDESKWTPMCISCCVGGGPRRVGNVFHACTCTLSGYEAFACMCTFCQQKSSQHTRNLMRTYQNDVRAYCIFLLKPNAHHAQHFMPWIYCVFIRGTHWKAAHNCFPSVVRPYTDYKRQQVTNLFFTLSMHAVLPSNSTSTRTHLRSMT